MAASPANGHVPHGLPMSGNRTPSSGFTAVNGDTQKSTSFKPDERVEAAAREADRSSKAAQSPSPVQYHTHGWRADSRVSHPPQQDGSEKNKRKRSDSSGIEVWTTEQPNQPRTDVAPSPKRRMTNHIDSAVDLTSPDVGGLPTATFLDRRAATPKSVRVSSRQPSPVPRWNRGEPVPPTRPEIEAGLAESLQRELHSAQQNQPQPQVQTHAQTQQRPTVETATSPVDNRNDPPEQSYSPDQQDGELDSRKRKRNFSNRTKTGCHTCRSRKKKCDEEKPVCGNCLRGHFQCGGYGPKPPGFKAPGATTRTPVALQSKPNYEPAHGPSTYFPSPMDSIEGRSYSHWGRIAEPEPLHSSPIDQRQSSSHRNDPWSRGPGWPPAEQPPYIPERLPPADFTSVPPLHAYAPGHPPPLHPIGSWAPDHHMMAPYRSLTGHGPGSDPRASTSNSTTSSSRAAALTLQHSGVSALSEKEKMLLGQPFLAYKDDLLLNDRQECKGALERYNDAAKTSSGVSAEERGRLFRAIVDPPYRNTFMSRNEIYMGPQGNVGRETVVESPFICDYGYNIHLGEEVLIQPGCYMQDACEVHIGNRTIIGPNVKFYGTTASVDPKKRKGSQGTLVGGAIKVGNDCFIGGDVIIMPFRKIGNGAVVGAGSVVTKDVKENTVVAGNPAKVIRRIEAGPNVDRHHNIDIEEQNELMRRDMFEAAKRGNDR